MLRASNSNYFRKGESHLDDGNLLFPLLLFCFLFYLTTCWYSETLQNPAVYAGAKVLIF